MRRIVLGRAVLAVSLLSALSVAQTLTQRPPAGTAQAGGAAMSLTTEEKVVAAPVTMPMSVAAGTPIKVALDSEVRIRSVGQPIHGKTVEPVYAFDKLLVPAGTLVNGKISAIDGVPGKTRLLDATDGNFSPARQVHVQFDELVMADGRHVALQTVASPAPNGVLRFVSANEKAEKKNKVEDAASKQVRATRQEIRRQWNDLQKQIHEPGKMHKLKRIALAQLPVHPQYIDAGTTFNADLLQPLDFGMEALKPEALTDIGTPPPTGSVVHARLVTPLSSSTAKQGDPVEALITAPLVVSDHLILPEGSVIKGSVVQAQPARRMGRNGQLRILFHQVAPPNGLEQKVETNLEGVAVAKDEHLKLDAEGGAQVTTPRTRYLTTGIQVMLAATQAAPDRDAGQGNPSVGEAGHSAANGASGFRFVGMIVGLAAHSRVVSAGFGSYGAAMSTYYHFLARGRDVVYPKDMAMVIGLGTRDNKSTNAAGPSARCPATGSSVYESSAICR
ncbi:conserved exported hypothetical protein [Candidatus Sulfotelmatobacter kueseliae]|uniref:Uncharacterized protein n=1 Tax=Candidatus Sulfotelmatobacter kueseliae TaxID=2042962 RepID=A0A2U3KN09_9BACT|nr:conserved exported hypothetical protein [Candidatus Sulfotelmatobacter kueseliae]